MEIERIYLASEKIEDNLDNWTKCDVSGLGYSYLKRPSSITHNCVYHAGLQIDNGRLKNPDELVEIHMLANGFTTYKHCRSVFFKSSNLT